jgi:hypothetical protein
MSFFEVVIAVVAGLMIYNAIQNDREGFDDLIGGAFKLAGFFVLFIPTVIYLSETLDLSSQYAKTIEKDNADFSDYIVFLVTGSFVLYIPSFMGRFAVLLRNESEIVERESLKEYVYGLLFVDTLVLIHMSLKFITGTNDIALYLTITAVLIATLWRYIRNLKNSNE